MPAPRQECHKGKLLWKKKVDRDNIFQSANFRHARLHDYLILSAQEVLQSQILHYILSILILCDNLLQRKQSGVIYL